MCKMILLNTCASEKIQFTDSEPKYVFSLTTLNLHTDIELRLIDDIIVDKDTAEFIREYPFKWIKNEECVQGIQIEAEKDVCRAFLSEKLGVDVEVFLKDKE